MDFKANPCKSQALGSFVVLTLTALELGLPVPSPSLPSGNSSPEKPDLLVGMPLSPSCQATAWCTWATEVLRLTPGNSVSTASALLAPRVTFCPCPQGRLDPGRHNLIARCLGREPSFDTMEEFFFPGQRAIAICRGPVITSEMGPVLHGPPPPSVSLWGKWFPHRLLAVLFSPPMGTQWDLC